jgi:cysteine synthase
MKGAIESRRIASRYPTAKMSQQFNNPANPSVHRSTTAVEIIEDTGARLDALVRCWDGGTITGVGEVLKERLKRCCGGRAKGVAVLRAVRQRLTLFKDRGGFCPRAEH